MCRGFQAAAEKAEREEKAAKAGALADEQRGQKVCVAFCLPCGTGTVLALAALVCVS